MRFSALALGSLALVDFTVGLDTKPADSSSVSIPIETSSHTTKNPSVTKTTSSSSPRWHPTVTAPPRSIFTTAVARRGDISISLTDPWTGPCDSGSTAVKQVSQTSVCTDETTKFYDQRPCATNWYVLWACETTATSHTSNDMSRRTRRWIAQYESKSNGLGGRSQRAVARFAEPTITAEPAPAVAGDPAHTTLPICSFNLEAGRYDCPKVALYTTLPICSFNLSAGRYDCPTPKIAEATATPCASGMIGPHCSTTVSKGPEPITLHTVRKA
jgi:hypothetical protein